ncbi:YerC/YecD family TrpR-related protein [Patescibacteria group bacterium]
MKNRNKNYPKWLTNDIEDLFKALLKIRNVKECEKFLRDLMTIPEIKTFAMRWKVANMLNEGDTYQKIEKQTGMSSTTIARINRWLEYGEGGYQLMLKRTKKK